MSLYILHFSSFQIFLRIPGWARANNFEVTTDSKKIRTDINSNYIKLGQNLKGKRIKVLINRTNFNKEEISYGRKYTTGCSGNYVIRIFPEGKKNSNV